MSYVVGVDVGGTNTDTAILNGQRVVTKAKTPTTQDRTGGVVSSIRAALQSLPEPSRAHVLENLARVSIGTTHFTNAVKKRDGRSLDRVAVLRLCSSASRGLPPFSDFPEELRQLVFGGAYMLSGGVEHSGREVGVVDPEEIRGCVQQLRAQTPPISHVVIAGVFAPCDEPCGRQERLAEEIIKGEWPEMSCTLSHQLGMLGLIERENAAVLNESLKSLARLTVTAFQEALAELNIRCPFYLTQNDGTMISAEQAMQFPVQTFSSGPTNSMRGAAFLSGQLDAIVVDIGGTTTDVGVLRNGFPQEASTHCMIGDVRTNFCMPDVQSIPLGGGTLVEYDTETFAGVKLGPDSVEYRLKEEALCFGGTRCTATDVAVAAGVAPGDFCTSPQALGVLSPRVVYETMREIRRSLEAVIDTMKTEKEDVLVILVGGGCILVDSQLSLKGVSRLILPDKHWDVANAVGAALGTVGGACDLVVNLGSIREELLTLQSQEGAGSQKGAGPAELEDRVRRKALERGRALARDDVIRKGADPVSVYIHSEDLSDLQYVTDRVRVKVKAIGNLTASQEAATTTKQGELLNGFVAVDPDKAASQQAARDNPHWPHTSAEDRSRDVAAQLPLPQVSGGVWQLSQHDVECLALGAGILGCGGGGDPHIGKLQAVKLLGEGREIRVVNPCSVEASEMGLVCGVGYMGAPLIMDEKLVGEEEVLLALTRVRQVVARGMGTGGGEEEKGEGEVRTTERKYEYPRTTPFPVQLADEGDLKKISLEGIPLSRQVSALTCLEVGGCNSIQPLLMGALTGLPVLDVDGMGRAFPELQMFLPFIYGCQHCPCSLADNKGEVVTCVGVETAQQLEMFFRLEAVRMGMSAGVALGVMPFDSIFSKMVLFTMSQAWQLGRAVQRAVNTHSSIIDAIVEQQQGLVLIKGKVTSVVRLNKDGFTVVESLVAGLDRYAGHQVRVWAKNENYVAERMDQRGERAEEVLACTPDLITIVDSDTGAPVTTSQVRYGLRVGVIVLPANPMLKTPQALAVVGPRAFNFDMDYRAPRGLL